MTIDHVPGNYYYVQDEGPTFVPDEFDPSAAHCLLQVLGEDIAGKKDLPFTRAELEEVATEFVHGSWRDPLDAWLQEYNIEFKIIDSFDFLDDEEKFYKLFEELTAFQAIREMFPSQADISYALTMAAHTYLSQTEKKNVERCLSAFCLTDETKQLVELLLE